MALYLSTLEHSRVPIQVREILSFTRAVTRALTGRVREMPGVSGCVLLSTCNRTELYISAPEPLCPGALLCAAAEVDYAPFAGAFYTCRDQEAVRHLLEVAAGLRSRVWGEDQIITQVKDAIALARSVHAADAVLETLFRIAVAAGKQVRAQARMTALPVSAASQAVELLAAQTDLNGKRALVIGNGEMGRLAASLLRGRGCRVTVTLRT
ncbi:MAG: glutamyl-tRNA reductase, partial [Oscillospiraceae bacterium]|nr:glutamyl-tRNA reductase [Oscillospiraceae bacterium]